MKNTTIYMIGLMVLGLIMITLIPSMERPFIFDDYLKTYKKENVLNGVILIGKGQSIIYHEAFGWANKEKNSRNTLNTCFLIGSITKTFTAAALVLLVQKGLITIDAPVSEYLTKSHIIWKNKIPDWASQITIHQLLTHSSGLAEYVTLPNFDEFYKKLHSSYELIQFFACESLKAKPGSTYSYSGSSYNLLGVIIEVISRQSYSNFLINNFFCPLKLRKISAPHTHLLSELQKSNSEIATGYSILNNAAVPAGDVNLSTAFAEASIISNAADLYEWLNTLFSNKIIDSKMVNKMTKSYLINSDGNGVGYGIYIDKSLGYEVFTHSGRINGFESIFLYEPKKKITVIILSNYMKSNIYPLAYNLMDLTYQK